ncbi:MAG: ABC transporter permease [Bauldia sp.]|nr:ABC transporter permease [Bauldia sp.]MCW5718148.1 ABC transporter permease [Bauldia sp.]
MTASETRAEPASPATVPRAPSRRDGIAWRLLRLAVPVVTLGLLVVIWQVAVDTYQIRPFILPRPSAVWDALIENWDTLSRSLWVTVKVTLSALGLAVAGGVLLSILMQSRWIELGLFPYAVILQVTPIVAVAPLLIIWTSPNTQLALLILAVLVAFFPILSNTTAGLKATDHNLLNLFELYGANPWQRLIRLKIPSALPYFLTGLRTAGGLALIAAVVAEFAAGSAGRGSGLAFRVLESQYRLQTARLFAALLLLSLTGVAIYFATSFISWLLLRRWHESAVRREN